MSAFNKSLLALFPGEGEAELKFLLNYTHPINGYEVNLAREPDALLAREVRQELHAIPELIELLQYRLELVRTLSASLKPRAV